MTETPSAKSGVAASIVDALKSQPLAIALMLINVMFLVAALYFIHDLVGASRAKADREQEIITTLITRCGPQQQPQ